jgi:hypothetical protein
MKIAVAGAQNRASVRAFRDAPLPRDLTAGGVSLALSSCVHGPADVVADALIEARQLPSGLMGANVRPAAHGEAHIT